MKAYQVLNESGCPASDELEDLCIFRTKALAKNFMRHLRVDCGISSTDLKKFKIVELDISERGRRIDVDAMRLSIVRLHKIEGNGYIKAFFDLSICDAFIVKGYRIIEGKDGLFVSAPRECLKDGKWYTTVIPLLRDVKDEIEKLAMEAYEG